MLAINTFDQNRHILDYYPYTTMVDLVNLGELGDSDEGAEWESLLLEEFSDNPETNALGEIDFQFRQSGRNSPCRS